MHKSFLAIGLAAASISAMATASAGAHTIALAAVAPSTALAPDTAAPVMAAPQLVSFGAVELGQEGKSREVTWTNTTNGTINIFNWVVISNPPFDFYNFDQSTCAQVGAQLLAAQSCSFEVIFRPGSIGKTDGSIVFSYYITDPAQPQFVTVTLKGTGK